MKNIIGATLLIVSTAATAGSVTANGTRFIYPSNQKEITVQLSNNSPQPALVQSWLDNGDPKASPDDITVPFTITPPVSKLSGNSGQTLRIRKIGSEGLASDRESLLYLNILEIPPITAKDEQSDKNILMMAIRSRFKFIYRPIGLGSADTAPSKLEFTPNGKGVTIKNPTPFYITVTKVTGHGKTNLNTESAMIGPKGTATLPLSTVVSHGEKITITVLNDYGSSIDYGLTTK